MTETPFSGWILGVRTELFLKTSTPRLYALETNKRCVVSDRWVVCNGVWTGNWSWRVPPCGRSLDDLSNLINLIGNVSLSRGADDKWVWSFNVKTLTSMIQNKVLIDSNLGKHHVCNSWVHRKVNVCTWRTSLDRIPTRANLTSMGIALPSKVCLLCEQEDETIDHFLCNFSKVKTI
nr:hypothetical protein [Tanacetum cinerariifolium]